MAIALHLCRRYIFTRQRYDLKNCLLPKSANNIPGKHFDSSPTDRVYLNESSNTSPLFDEMPCRDVESVTTLIGQFADDGRHREAVLCFLRMLLLDIRPNEYTLGTVIHSSIVLRDSYLGKQLHSYATRINLNSNVFVGSAILDLYVKLSNFDYALRAFEDIHEPNVVSQTTLIRGYMKEGRFDEAQVLFGSMPERNVVSWNTMISCCSQSGRNEEAVNFFTEMLREGVMPSQSTYPCAIISAANIGSLGMGRSIHSCAIKFLGQLSLFLSNSLISFYAKCGSMEDSLLVFKKMQKRNVVSWNALICGYAQNGQGNDAIEAYEKMKLTDDIEQPNSVTLLGLLSASSHVGLVDEGYKYFHEARSKNSSLLKAEHYACMIDLLSRSGRFQEAERFLHDLPFDPGVGFWKTLLGGCYVHSNTQLGEVAATNILKLNPEDVSSYVMLSNAHSAAGRWRDVLDIRGKIRGKGLSRIPGSSWIEIKGEVHVFVTSDNKHSERDEIYKVLGFLLECAMDTENVLSL